MTRFTPLAISFMTISACGHYRAPTPITDGRVATVGCYRLRFGAWSKGSSVPDSMLAAFPLPQTVHLVATGRITPRYSPPGQWLDGDGGEWSVYGTDSLLVRWWDDILALRFTPTRDSLLGTAQLGFAEAHGVTWPSTTVVAWPVPCR